MRYKMYMYAKVDLDKPKGCSCIQALMLAIKVDFIQTVDHMIVFISQISKAIVLGMLVCNSPITFSVNFFS